MRGPSRGFLPLDVGLAVQDVVCAVAAADSDVIGHFVRTGTHRGVGFGNAGFAGAADGPGVELGILVAVFHPVQNDGAGDAVLAGHACDGQAAAGRAAGNGELGQAVQRAVPAGRDGRGRDGKGHHHDQDHGKQSASLFHLFHLLSVCR